MDNNNSASTNTVPVKDISVASFIFCSDKVRLERTERKNNNLVIFHFTPKEEVEKLIAAYWSDTAVVAPRKVFMAERSLKDLIFSGGYQ